MLQLIFFARKLGLVYQLRWVMHTLTFLKVFAALRAFAIAQHNRWVVGVVFLLSLVPVGTNMVCQSIPGSRMCNCNNTPCVLV